MDPPRGRRGSAKPKQKQNQDRASSSGDQIRASQHSAAGISTRTSQDDTTKAQKESNQNDQNRSRCFNRGRKRSEVKSLSSSSMGATSQTEAVNKSLTNSVQDGATKETGGQDGSRKRRRRRPRARGKENCGTDAINNNGSASCQSSAQGGATENESRNTNHCEIQEQQQRHPKQIPKATKSVPVKGIDETLPKSGLQSHATGKGSRSQDGVLQKQTQEGLQKRSQQNATAATEIANKDVFQNDIQATGGNSEKQDSGTRRRSRNRRRNRRAVSKSVDAVTSNGSASSQKGLPNGVKGNKSSQTVFTNSQEKTSSSNGEPKCAAGDEQSRIETSKSVPIKSQEKKFSLNDDATDSATGELTQSKSQNAQSETNKTDVAKSQEKLPQNKRLGEISKQNQRKAQNKNDTSITQDLEKTSKEMDVNNNPSKNNEEVKTTKNELTTKNKPEKDPRRSKTKAEKKTRNHAGLKALSLDAMRGLLDESPEEIVTWLRKEQSSLFSKKQQKFKDEAVAVLLKLLAKARDCKSHSDLTHLFSILPKSWFLTQRVGPILDRFATKKSKKSETKHFSLETIRGITAILTEIVTRFPNDCRQLPLVKLQSATASLLASGKLVDKETISAVNELMKIRKKEEITRRKQEKVQRSQPARAGNVLRFI